jgi:hypothetical protein
VADVLPADQAAQAHRRLAEGGLWGRLVLDFTTMERFDRPLIAHVYVRYCR